MRVRAISLNSSHEVIVKIVKELLALFKIRVVGPEAQDADLRELRMEIELLPAARPRLLARLIATGLDGNAQVFSAGETAAEGERESSAVHRLAKLNLYRLFRAHFGMPAAPWGILHGVRPVKIVHRYIDEGMDAEGIVERLMRDYEVSRQKAECLAQVAFRQRPFLATSDERTISVYVGIPFCLSRCLYCSFPSHLLPTPKKLGAFMDVWHEDLGAAARSVEKHGLKVQNIYIGGGTPTSLPDEVFSEMLHAVRDAFFMEGTREFTVEAGRPDSMSEAKIACMRACHVSRVSVNPQTMQERTLKRIGRNHSPEDIVAMFHALRRAGIPQINMDAIIGLPGETDADVADTMRKIVALAPDDITLHALALKRGSRLKLNLQDYELPDDAMAQKMFRTAMHYIEEAGMRPYYLYRQGYMSGQMENVGCCRDGAEGMYNIQIMVEHQTIIGIGGAATTKVVDFREKRIRSSFNAKDLATYLRDIETYIEKRTRLLDAAYQ